MQAKKAAKDFDFMLIRKAIVLNLERRSFSEN